MTSIERFHIFLLVLDLVHY